MRRTAFGSPFDNARKEAPMITGRRQVAIYTFMVLPLVGAAALAQQPQPRANPSQGGVNAGRGNPVVQRAATLQVPDNQAWQAGDQQQPAAAARPGLPQPRAAMPPARAPFVLTPQEEQQLNQILSAWEQTSNAVKTYKSQFTRWEYDTVFGPKTDARTRCQGELKFMAPDKGSFRITSVYNPTTKKYESGPPDQLEHWVCDG